MPATATGGPPLPGAGGCHRDFGPRDTMVRLNQLAERLCQCLLRDVELLKITAVERPDCPLVVDGGVETPGGLEAGCRIAEICMAGLGHARLAPGDPSIWNGPVVMVQTDHAVRCCMASQYAGWEISGDTFFAMGSGPMRAAAAREDLIDELGCRERTDVAVGVLESDRIPPPEVCRDIARKCHVANDRLTLIVAPTRSLAGTVQVVSRSAETAMHKLHEQGFDLTRVQSAVGWAPLPPPSPEPVTAIGRTNDAIIYGGHAMLFVQGDDGSLAEAAGAVPSNSARAFGRPFAEIFEQSNRNFYDIDPGLFSPAMITMINLDTGQMHRAGQMLPEIVHESFTGTGRGPEKR